MNTKITLMLIASLVVGSAGAAVIPVSDPGFDTYDTAGWIYVNDPLVTEWDSPTGSAWIGDEAAYSGGAYPDVAHSGTQWVDLNGQMIFQNVSATYIEGYTYTLTVWALGTTTNQGLYMQFAADSPNGWKGASNEYLAGSSSLISVPNDGSTWIQYSFEYTAVTADAGKTIGINLYGRAQTNIDGVSLTVTQAPTAIIPVSDPGFDTYDTAGWIYVNDPLVTEWDSPTGSAWIGDEAAYSGGAYPAAALSGTQWVDLNGATIFQNVSATYVEGNTYTLTVWALGTTTNQGMYLDFAADSPDGWIGASNEYLAGGGAGDFIAVLNDGSTWLQYSSEYTAVAADAGKTIGINIYGRSQTNIDGVSLTVTQAPTETLITGFSPSGSGVVKMEFICQSLETSYPFTKADLVGGSWTNVEHSIDGNAPWYTTNLSYSGTVSGSTNKIFLKTIEDAAFFGIGD